MLQGTGGWVVQYYSTISASGVEPEKKKTHLGSVVVQNIFSQSSHWSYSLFIRVLSETPDSSLVFLLADKDSKLERYND